MIKIKSKSYLIASKKLYLKNFKTIILKILKTDVTRAFSSKRFLRYFTPNFYVGNY